MDPYLERHWLDVHQAICTYARDQLQAQLGHGLKARLGERRVHELLIDFRSESIRQGYIEIVANTDDDRVVSTIEFVSPTNKFGGDGQRKYEGRRKQVFSVATSLVEIDLTRAGTRNLLVPASLVPKTAYSACVHRGSRTGQMELYPIPLRERLPNIAVPLREAEPDVVLKLQPLIDAAYQNGSYEDIDYSQPPEPPLEDDDAAWADELLRQAGKR